MKKMFHSIGLFCIVCLNAVFSSKPAPMFMALIKFGVIVSDVRGTFAGGVFSRIHAGAVLRQKVSPINPKTIAQQAVRTLMTTISQSWRGLTEAQRIGWNQGASSWARTNVFGDNSPLTGSQLYTRLNRNLQTIGESMITDIPVHSAVVGIDTFVLDADTLGGGFDLTYTPAIPANQHVAIYATNPLSAGISFVKSEFKFLEAIVAADISPYDASVAYIAVFGALPVAGEKVFCRMKPIMTATGQTGVALEASDIAV